MSRLNAPSRPIAAFRARVLARHAASNGGSYDYPRRDSDLTTEVPHDHGSSACITKHAPEWTAGLRGPLTLRATSKLQFVTQRLTSPKSFDA